MKLHAGTRFIWGDHHAGVDAGSAGGGGSASGSPARRPQRPRRGGNSGAPPPWHSPAWSDSYALGAGRRGHQPGLPPLPRAWSAAPQPTRGDYSGAMVSALLSSPGRSNYHCNWIVMLRSS